MASEELAPSWLACAQCETSQATLECLDEELLYCAPCSASLHSKKARLHHSVKRFRTCDECEAAVARVQCASCAGRQSEPLVFCVDCSALLHSKKARQHHQVESILSSCRRGVSQNAFKEDNTHKTALNTTEEDAKETPLQDVKEIPLQDAAPCTEGALTIKEEGFQGGELSNTLNESKEATTNEAGLMSMEMMASIKTQESATTRIGEASLALTDKVFEPATITQEAPLNVTLDTTLTEQAIPANTQEVIQNKTEGDGLGLSKKTPAAIANTQDTCSTCATRKVFLSSHQQDTASPSTREAATPNVAKDARAISNPAISKPPPHHFPHCTPPFLPRHYFAGPWPVRPMEFTHNAFHGAHYNATFIPPSFQAYEVARPPGYVPHSNQYYTGFIPQIDCSSSAYTPPTFAYANSDSIHSKSDDWHGTSSNKRLWSSLYEVNMVPTSDIQGGAFAGNVSKRTHAGEDATCVNLPNQVYGEYTIRNAPKNLHETGFPEELSKKVEQTGIAAAPFLEKEQASGSSEEKSQKNSFGKAPPKAALASGSPEASANMVNGVPPEVSNEKVAVTDVLPERVFATNISGEVSERVSASGVSREELPDVLLPSIQLDDSSASRTPRSGLPDTTIPITVGKAPNEKLASDILSSEFVPPPVVPLDDSIPLREPSSGLLDKVVPIANDPAGEVRNTMLANDRLSSEVLSEIVSPGASPLKAMPKMAATIVRPKEEPVDILPGEDVLFEFAGSFSGGVASPEMTIRNKIPGRDLKKFVTRQEYTLQESNIVRKYFSKEEPINSPSQVTPNVLPHVSDEKETSGDSSEPSYNQEDSSADDETFNLKKYRRGTVTLEAVVRNGDVDASRATTGYIYTMLKRGLRCSTYDDDARQALRNAQRRLTKYNLKQAGAAEGSLQNAEALKAGWCMVELVPTGSSQRCCSDCWTKNLAHTVAKYFASDYCAQKLKVVFYGIAQNAHCAGHAFAATFNRVTVLSAEYVPEKLLDEGDLVEIDRNGKCANKSVFSRTSRMAYRSDLVQALYKIAKRSRQLRAVKLERGESGNRVGSHVSTRHRVWMEGVPMNASLVKRYGNETMEALMIHCRKACNAFVKTKNWTIIASKLAEP